MEGDDLRPYETLSHREASNMSPKESAPHTGVFGGIFLLSATVLGAGILAIPHTYNLAGIVNASVSLLVVAIINVFSIWMMMKASDAINVESYEELANKSIPYVGKYISMFFFNILLFGSLSSFLVIIADLLQDIVRFISPTYHWYTDRTVVLLVFVILFVFPLCMLRNISLLEYSSFVAVVLITFFTCVITYQGSVRIYYSNHPSNDTHGYLPIDWSHLKLASFRLQDIFQSLPIIALAYSCQTNVFPIRSELTDPTIARMNRVNLGANLISAFLYILMGFFGYVLYLDIDVDTNGNIINALPEDVFSSILRGLFTVAILFHYPVLHFGMRNSIELTFFSNDAFSWFRHTVLTIIIMGCTMMFAISVPSLSKVIGLTGSLAAFPICFIFPAFFYIRCCFFLESETPTTYLVNNVVQDCLPTKPLTVSNLTRLGLIPPYLVILFSIVAMAISIFESIAEFTR